MSRGITLTLPEPPSLNEMIDLAKKRTRISRTGGWMKKSLPIVYDQAKEDYELRCLAAFREAGHRLPETPIARWTLDTAHFRVHGRRDLLELLAGLKWTVDWLVHAGIVANDGPDDLLSIPRPTQVIDRAHRSVTITVTPAE